MSTSPHADRIVNDVHSPRRLPAQPMRIAVSWVWLAAALRGLRGIGVTAIVVVALAGCGGGSSSLAGGLDPYLIKGNEETGYTVQRPLEHYRTAAGYAASEQNSLNRPERLRDETEKLRAQIQDRLEPSAYQAAWESGQRRQLAEVVAQILG